MKKYKVLIKMEKTYDILSSNSNEACEQAAEKFEQEFGYLSMYDVFDFFVNGSPYVEEDWEYNKEGKV